ncbi:DNA integrity scanning protein DisA nucleotide-binding domain protein [Anaeromyxobacter oryzisoli]|jgi:diadenylate cyclase|uniref:DNA integrity scanning protein DisA nucleotide-binding domain protein n=1 Tax=Anaeromyxobacter oryzisoli TaxID=2925408 RepID=UPI001F5642BA|nr:diadenylate cyclase [Anaeromyxobacter sp. SG63]
MADGKFDREFLRGALALMSRSEVDRLLYVSDHPLSPAELRGRPIKRKLVYAVTSDGLANQLKAKKYTVVLVPPYDYTRVEKIKVAVVAAQSAGLLKDGDTVLALAGPGNDRVMDTLVKVLIGSEDPEEKLRVDTLGLPPEFSSQVVESLIHTAMEIGAEGYEGSPVGTIIVIGDSTAVMEKSRQLILNPFQGISEAERNALDPPIREAVKTFSALDGAFIIREDGVVLAAGRYLLTMSRDVKLPMGLGARHSAAASISAETKAVAITVSQTTGTVRVFREGEIVLELRQKLRRV